MIAARIDHHVGARRHVTFDAARARRSHLVEMMRRRVVLLRRMTLRTEGVAVRAKFRAVRIVTIAARHAGVEHPALDEGAVLVVLLLYLAVGEIVVLIEQRDAVIVADRLSMHIVLVNLAAPRVASRTRLDFAIGLTRRASTRVTGGWIDRPRNTFALIERERQTFGRVERLPIALFLCPRNVIRAGAVTSLARHIDLGVGSRKRASASVVVLAKVGRMAVGAHVVPVLIDAGPVPRVIGRDLLTGI